jgi:hypothetical protein
MHLCGQTEENHGNFSHGSRPTGRDINLNKLPLQLEEKREVIYKNKSVCVCIYYILRL